MKLEYVRALQSCKSHHLSQVSWRDLARLDIDQAHVFDQLHLGTEKPHFDSTNVPLHHLRAEDSLVIDPCSSIVSAHLS